MSPTTETVEVQLGERTVKVPKGGIYDRYRMETDLDEIARDPRVGGVEFFREQPKTRVDSPIGPTLTPNYYYRISSARLVMLARTKAVRRSLPKELAPLEVVPGLSAVSVMFFRYDVCDIDFYTEAAVAIAVRPARHGRGSLLDAATGLKNEHLHAYVLALPLNSEIGQVRGYYGYGFPKWLTQLDVDIDAGGTAARIANDAGGTDLALTAPTPGQTVHQSGDRVSTLTSYTTIAGAWHATTAQTNVLQAGKTMSTRGVELEVGEGRCADALRSLDPKRTVQLEVVTHGQLTLHMPVPTSMPRPDLTGAMR